MFSSLKSAVYNNHISIKTALAYFADALFRLHVYPCPEKKPICLWAHPKKGEPLQSWMNQGLESGSLRYT